MRQRQALTAGSSVSAKMRHVERSKIRINCARQLYIYIYSYLPFDCEKRNEKKKKMQPDDIYFGPV